MRTTSKGEGSASWSSVGFTPRKTASEDENVFSFREARVQEYLSSLSEVESSGEDSLQKPEGKEEIPAKTDCVSIETIHFPENFLFEQVLLQGNTASNSISSITEGQSVKDYTPNTLSQPGPSNKGSNLVLPISSSTRSKKKQSYKLPLSIDMPPEGCRADSAKEITVSYSVQKPRQHKAGKETGLFERPLTRARKRHMAKISEKEQFELNKRRKDI